MKKKIIPEITIWPDIAGYGTAQNKRERRNEQRRENRRSKGTDKRREAAIVVYFITQFSV